MYEFSMVVATPNYYWILVILQNMLYGASGHSKAQVLYWTPFCYCFNKSTYSSLSSVCAVISQLLGREIYCTAWIYKW